MSFEVYLCFFNRGEPSSLPLATIKSIFPVIEDESETAYWSVRYDELNSCHISVTLHEQDSSQVQGLIVWRPCKDFRLWTALMEIMRIGQGVLLFPGSPPLVADMSVEEHLPQDMIESLGQPRIVSSAQEIMEVISHS